MTAGDLVTRALATMRGKRAVLLGDLVLDAYVYGETVRVSREAPVIVVRKERTEYRLGGAANTAANLAKLGVTTEVIGAVAKSQSGEALRRMLAESGAEIRDVREADFAMPVKTRVFAGAFGTSRQQVLRLDEEPSCGMTTALLTELAERLLARAMDADVVVLSDYGYGLAEPPIIEAALELARRGKLVCVDSRRDLPKFAGVSAVTPNVPEAEAVVGFAINDQESAHAAGRALVERLRVDTCLLTQGKAGMTLFRGREEPLHEDIVGEREVTDVTGAGDSVIATFAAGLAAGIGMINSMRLANVAAGVVVGKMGAATAEHEEIAAAAKRHEVTLEPWAS